MADLGTGCGALALALARERPGWQIVATDVSAAALGVAQRNAQALGVSIALRHGDWYAAARRASVFDLLLSNPPYVAADDPALRRAALRAARGAHARPRRAARACARWCAAQPRHLAPGGWLLLEHGATQGAEVRA